MSQMLADSDEMCSSDLHSLTFANPRKSASSADETMTIDLRRNELVMEVSTDE